MRGVDGSKVLETLKKWRKNANRNRTIFSERCEARQNGQTKHDKQNNVAENEIRQRMGT